MNPRPRTRDDFGPGFNPRPHEGRPCDRGAIRRAVAVSIPAPCARGDSRRRVTGPGLCRFNPRPARGASRERSRARCSRSCFNPRACVRGDFALEVVVIPVDVSIHAPAQGETQYDEAGNVQQYWFQPASSRGGDLPVHDLLDLGHIVSIHAPARRATRPTPGCHHRRCRFNPRFYARSAPGADHGENRDLPVSIHTPARGETRRPC